MATPITYLKFKDASSIIDVPIYSPADVTDSSFRIMTSKGLGCFDLIAPTTNTPLRVMTQNGIKGINETLISTGPTIIVEDFLDDTYNFTFEHGTPYGFTRFNGASPNGNLGYFKSTNQGINTSSCNVSFDVIVPTGKTSSRLEVDYFVDSEVGYDFLRIHDNEVVNFSASGLNQVGTASFPLSVGNHNIRIAYNKDGNSSDYTDTVYINEIRLIIE